MEALNKDVFAQLFYYELERAHVGCSLNSARSLSRTRVTRTRQSRVTRDSFQFSLFSFSFVLFARKGLVHSD